MFATPALLVVCALAGGGDAVLLDFTSQNCGPCRSMAPVIAQFERAGYPVRKVDVQAEPQIARQFNVGPIPCFVMVVGGQEVDRVVGATSPQRLSQMFAKAAPARGPMPAPALAGQPNGGATGVHETALQAPRTSAGPISPTGGAAVDRAMAATVRLKVEDPKSYSYGTGTIIHTHGQEGLVVTCGHIFRDSQGKGNIQVDLFAAGAGGPTSAQLVHYDLDRDIALVSIRASINLTAVQVVGQGHENRLGDRVFGIGCNKGSNPTVIEGRVLSTANCHITTSDKQQIALLEVSGKPIEGRSGGGLFTADGRLVGVCNFADKDEDKGFYASTETVQGVLDKKGLPFVYRTQSNPTQMAAAPNGPSVPSPAVRVPAAAPFPEVPNMASAMPNAMLAPNPTAPNPAAIGGDTEVLVIVRSKQNPHANNVFVVQQPSAAFIDSLARESRQPGAIAARPPPAQPAPR